MRNYFAFIWASVVNWRKEPPALVIQNTIYALYDLIRRYCGVIGYTFIWKEDHSKSLPPVLYNFFNKGYKTKEKLLPHSTNLPLSQ
jgi:hypothetical protein